jgi:ribosome-binding ATPase YchF (GTP1/OBG family)
VEFDLMLSDLTQVEKRLERLEKDLKKGARSDLEKREQALLFAQGVAGKRAAAARTGDDQRRRRS